MSQFTSRFQSSSSHPQMRDNDVRLRMSPENYKQENADSVYSRRHQDAQKIKNLSFWDNTDAEDVDENEWIERQSTTPFILVIVILVVVSTLLWFMYQWASSEAPSTPPIIAADTAPFKVRPDNPGGMMIPHQDKLVYGRLSQDPSQPIERLLPPPEQPVEHPPHSMAAPPYHPPYSQGQQDHGQIYTSPNSPPTGYAPHHPPMGTHPQPAPQYAPPPQPYPPFQAQPTYPQQSPPVQDQPPYSASQAQASYGPPPLTPMPPAVLPTIPQPPLHPISQPEDKKSSIVGEIKPASDEDEDDDTPPHDGRNELDQLIAREAEKPLKRSAKKNPGKLPQPTTMGLGKHKVQIASLPSRAMAENEMKRLRDHHGPFFDNKPWSIQKINLGTGRGITHRLVVGSFPNHNAATKFCKRLRAEKIGCLVIAPATE